MVSIKIFIILSLISIIIVNGCVDNVPRHREEVKYIVLNGERILLSCLYDRDCTIIDIDEDYKTCCGRSPCKIRDYSKDNYIAVNGNSFLQFHNRIRPTDCGGCPECYSPEINSINFSAKCIDNKCLKIALGKEEICMREGGEWKKAGLTGIYRCIHKYPDGGKPCTSSNECIGLCIVTGPNIPGFCKYDDSPFGCYATIENVQRGEPILCVD